MLTDLDLVGIEEIKQLKARYWRAVDTKDFQLLRSVFAAECVVDFRDAMLERDETKLWRDPDQFCEDTKLATQGVLTVHHGFPPEISVTSEHDAEGIWPFEDLVWVREPNALLPFKRLRGYGHYREKYRRTTTGWNIQSIYISRVHMECE